MAKQTKKERLDKLHERLMFAHFVYQRGVRRLLLSKGTEVEWEHGKNTLRGTVFDVGLYGNRIKVKRGAKTYWIYTGRLTCIF